MIRAILLLFVVGFCVACAGESATKPRVSGAKRLMSNFRVSGPDASSQSNAAGANFSKMADDERNHDRLSNAAARGLPAIGIANASLMGEAAAIIVRNPGSAQPRLVVLNARYLNDDLLSIGQSLMLRDEIRQPESLGERRLTLYINGKMKLEANGATKWAAWRGGVAESAGTKRVKELNTRAGSTKNTLRVEGIGEVRLLRQKSGH